MKFLSLDVDYSKRVFGLDLMRAIAIVNVVIVHASWMGVFEKYPWIPIIPGVELFFVLSGFLIGTILLKTYLKEETFGFRQIARFWKRRWFRTLPNYYLILVLNIIVTYFGIIRADLSQFNWKFLLFVQNLYDEFHGFFWESWSLTIEEWFYLSFPIILFFLNLILKKTLKKQHIFLANIIIYLCFSFTMRYFIGSNLKINDSYWYDVMIHKVIIYHLDGIALGLLAAYIKYFSPEFWHKNRNITFIFGLTICLLMPYFGWEPTSPTTIIYRISVQSLGCFLLLPRFETIKTAPKILTKTVTHISLISYSMYLINLSLVALIINTHVQISGKTEAALWYAVYWVTVVVFSTIIYKFYEKPFMDLRDKI